MGMPSPESVSTKQQRIAEMARQAPEMAFTSLSHHIDMDWLREAYRRTRKDGATGETGSIAKYDTGMGSVQFGVQQRPLSSFGSASGFGSFSAGPTRRDFDRVTAPPSSLDYSAGR